ncbi:hypothetical protein GA0061081_102234 [Gilliamella bombicola]|uniref:Uncharacterized protein n=1 Tax=Gilliamella bombicola TaxID=1798182 RepID=A0A1C4A4K8_9GAMM|nr:hypothetical protein GA0061081_102234 [Gilliamella bombicola]
MKRLVLVLSLIGIVFSSVLIILGISISDYEAIRFGAICTFLNLFFLFLIKS